MDKFNNQNVRDLAWAVSVPPLIKSADNDTYNFLSKEYFDIEYNNFKLALYELDKDPTELTEHLQNGNTVLLGKYFESLIEFWITKSKTKELLTHNLQVFHNRKTIGEFDFVYRDLTTGEVIHIECAGKFYIAHKPVSNWDNFIGPNAIDNLGRKLHKVFTDQIGLSKTDEGKEALFLEGIEEKIHPKILLKGYLFYYADYFFSSNFVMPEHAEESHYKGWWIYAKDIDYFFREKKNKWVIIERMNWVSRVYNPPAEDLLTTAEIISKLNDYFRTDSYPLLIAELDIDEDGLYTEVSRGFVVSNHWPKRGL